MGYSISQETYERIERNRREGRLCRGGSRCSSRGTWWAFHETWVHKIGEGDSKLDMQGMPFCKKHLREFAPHVGFEGVNYRVVRIKPIPKGWTKEVAA